MSQSVSRGHLAVLAALVLPVLGVSVVAGAVGPSGQASAQSGARLCGWAWKNDDGDVIARLAKVPRGKGPGGAQCEKALNDYADMPDRPTNESLLGHALTGIFGGAGNKVYWDGGICEEVTQQLLLMEPSGQYTDDVCLRMVMSESVDFMHQYLIGGVPSKSGDGYIIGRFYSIRES